MFIIRCMMFRRFALLIMAVFLSSLSSFVVFSPSAYACSCLPPESPELSRDQASAVFSGTVTAIHHADASETDMLGFANRVDVTLAVSDVWKGVVGETVTVGTAWDSAACGYPFAEGESYLVYTASSPDESGMHHVSLCGRTTLLSSADGDMQSLGEPYAPSGASGEASGAIGSTSWVVFLMIAAIAIIVPIYASRKGNNA